MPKLFIQRPVATILLALLVMMAGVFGYLALPVASLPQVDYPTISVSAQLTGASPNTMATAVATPLIKAFETIAGVNTITAHSTNGNTQIVLQFDLSRDIDAAANDVQSAIASSARRLPADMTSPPSYRKANPADAPILLLALQSSTLPLTEIDSLAQNVISPSLSTVDGVAQAQIFGSRTYAVRVDVNPDKLAARGIAINQVSTAIASANSHLPLGSVQNQDQNLTIESPTQLTDAAGFRSLIIANPNGNPLRLGDVANVYDSVQNLNSASWYDGKLAIALAVFRQPGANTVKVVDAIKASLPQLQAALPSAVTLSLTNDASLTIRNSVHDVEITLGITILLVILVIYLFLNRLLATLIPAVAVPLSLVAACAGMYVLGFSIDNISLLALTLSVGLVVDDAIVMLENIVRHVEEGKSPMEAALLGSGEVAWTIVSMSVSLVAVFLPILLMGGVVGRLFNEFGLVVAMAIGASALVSLTVTPMLAARLPASQTRKTRGPTAFDRVRNGYQRAVALCLRHRWAVMIVFLATVGASYVLFTVLPSSFFPPEDTGQLTISTQARQDISFADLSALQQQVADRVQASPSVLHVSSNVGGGNTGQMFVQLKPKGQRPAMTVVVNQLRASLAQVAGINSFILPTQSLRFGGRASAAQYQLAVQSLDQQLVTTWSTRIADAMTADPAHFLDVNTDLNNSALQVHIDVDRDRANALGITAAAIRTALDAGFGGTTPATIESTADSYSVILEYDQSLPWSTQLLSTIGVQSTTGAGTSTLVPLSTFATVSRSNGPLAVNQTGQLTSVTVSFNLPQGVALGEATARIAAIKQEIALPTNVITSYGGTAQVFVQSAANEWILILAAIATIYVVLGVLYESFVHPITILSGLPAAAFGALLALKLAGLDLSVIALIGILMLIGIVKKNAIMMVDVALVLQRGEGLSAAEAIQQASVRRFRPIMMTTFCALLAAIPIALGIGNSAELRQPLGIAVVGGLVVSQLLTLFITPVIFVELDALAAWVKRSVARLRGIDRRPREATEKHRLPERTGERPAAAVHGRTVVAFRGET